MFRMKSGNLSEIILKTTECFIETYGRLDTGMKNNFMRYRSSYHVDRVKINCAPL